MKGKIAISLLRNKGLKATPARISVLQFLEKQKIPISIDKILRKVPGIDKVTAYRIMEHLTNAGLVSRHDIGHQHHDYELSIREHHHHLICTTCNALEDIDLTEEESLLKNFIARKKIRLSQKPSNIILRPVQKMR